MDAIKINVVPDTDGKIILEELPVRSGESLEVIILKTDGHENTDKILEHSFLNDKAWQFLKEEEDLYTDEDCKVKLK